MQAAAFAHAFPTSLAVQYFSAPTALQRIPLGQPPSEMQARVQRFGPFFHIGSQVSPAEHSPSAAQRSSSPFVPPPPPEPLEAELLLLEAELLLLEAALELDEELALAAPPIPPVPPTPPMPPDPGPAPPMPPWPSSGKHCPA